MSYNKRQYMYLVVLGSLTTLLYLFYMKKNPDVPAGMVDTAPQRSIDTRKYNIIESDMNFTSKFARTGSDKKLASKYSSVDSDKWIVVTTISYPTPDVRFLAAIPGWQLLVVGDTKTPEDWSLPKCIYLSVDNQQHIGLRTTSHVPTKSYARKNIGYLFAISHGAKVIYETDDDNRPMDRLKNFVLKPSLWTLAFDGKDLFNPYRYFGQPTLWPRGYPLSAVGGNYSSDYIFDHYKTPLIQQGVVNGDPDMDAIFRLTRKQTTSILNVTFDQRAPPVIVPNGVLSPFNSQNTLFLYDAFWALLLPVTTTQRVCDIWRGYWSQRLMWEIGGHLAFFPPNAFQKRNAHSYLQDAVEEKDLYFKTERLVTFLQKWKCGVLLSFFQCVIQLTTDMSSQGFLKSQDVLLVNSWVEDLKSIGYKEPTRKPFRRFHSIPEVVLVNQSSVGQSSRIKFHAASKLPPSLNQNQIVNPVSSKLADMQKFCNTSAVSFKVNSLLERVKTFPDIILIIVFNFPYYKNIHFLEALYRIHFPNILYCGSSREEFDKQIGDNMTVSFIEVDIMRGIFGHKCLIQAMKMNYKVDGYLYMGDDVLLSVWNFHEHPLDKLWVKRCQILQLSVKSKWSWLNSKFGKMAYEAGLKVLQHKNPKRLKRYLKLLKNVTGFADGVCHCMSDIIYVPEKYKNELLFFVETFTKFKIFVELLIPTVFYGMEQTKNLYVMPGKYLGYDGKRASYENHFNSSELFIHPIKLSKGFAREKGQKFFCETVFPLTLT